MSIKTINQTPFKLYSSNYLRRWFWTHLSYSKVKWYSWVWWLHSQCIRETPWTNSITFVIHSVGWVVLYPIHLLHSLLEIQVSSFSTLTTVRIMMQIHLPSYSVRVSSPLSCWEYLNTIPTWVQHNIIVTFLMTLR